MNSLVCHMCGINAACNVAQFLYTYVEPYGQNNNFHSFCSYVFGLPSIPVTGFLIGFLLSYIMYVPVSSFSISVRAIIHRLTVRNGYAMQYTPQTRIMLYRPCRVMYYYLYGCCAFFNIERARCSFGNQFECLYSVGR